MQKQIYEGPALPENDQSPNYGPWRITRFMHSSNAEIIDPHSTNLMSNSTAHFIVDGVAVKHAYTSGFHPKSVITLTGEEGAIGEVEKKILDYCNAPEVREQ